jgi:sugar-specific transcriptional regulator TrmB
MSNFLPLGIRHMLEQTDWNPHEIIVYSTLLEKGAMDLSRIALETNIGTSSVQYALKKLHERQMVTKFMMNSKPRWKAKELDALRRWFKGRTQQFRMNEEAVQHFIDQYDFHPDGSTPSVEFHEGMKAVKRSLEEIGNRCSSNKILAVALLHKEMNTELLQFMQNGYADGYAKGMDIRVLAAGDVAIVGHNICRVHEGELRTAMQLSEGTNVLLVIADNTVFTMHCDEKGMSSIMMEYPQMAVMLRGMFECLWRDNHD